MERTSLGTSYFGCRAPDFVRQDMEYLKRCGVTEVLHTCSEEDYFFYKDNMKDIARASRDSGLFTYFGPWGLAGVFGGEAFSRFLLMNPEDWQVASDGRRYPAACLNSPRLLEFLLSWVDLAVASGADAVFWDEPHWFLPLLFVGPDRAHLWGCRCDVCRALYEEETGVPMPEAEDDSVRRFKSGRLSALILRLSEYAKSKGLKVAVCLLPVLDTREDRRHWEQLAAHPAIDILSTDPYWAMGETGMDSHYALGAERFVFFFASELNELCTRYGKQSMLWIQTFRLYGEEETVRLAVRAARRAGVDKIFSWAFKGSEYMSFLRCRDSEAAWRHFLEAGRERPEQGA